ncbi:hypothetical protein [Selenomonas ruminantium]|uniref:Uncharacterized protein n=1 Tax=Selenomonas ruminantium TaxID=971 RepID=A0A1H0UTH3_SELRU|nr:hypothetical protein [Selenomonas ruminantium]SDP69517.1 hypothetical protein SAMN05216366_13816 [Selenomonas ruminantium]
MENKFSVAISFGHDLGWIDYDGDSKSAVVNIKNDEAKSLTEKYLAEKHSIKVPHATLMDFTAEEVDPLADVKSFKLALTRLWNITKVHVDWSRPVDYVKEHPSY